MAESVDYCRSLKKAGLSTVYLQFDGVTPEVYKTTRGFDLFEIKKRALANLKAGGFRSVVLVPVLVGGANEDQVGDIIRFAIEHKDIVRCINFQPVSITGRINKKERQRMRITIPDLMRLAEEQTNGLVKQGDWYPVSTVMPFIKFIGNLKRRQYIEFSAHPHCGMATYLIVEGDEVIPISKQLNIDGLLKAVSKANEKFTSGKKTRAGVTAVSGVMKNVRLGALRKYILPVIMNGDYSSLSKLHHNMIMIGSMHFMDPYNFDLERVERCVIHYGTPDGRLIPFCTMNTLHRASIEKKFAKPLDEKTNTPLYDVEKLTERILSEEASKAS
jgi:uncharacterized radical SAM superfamily Fe-S cluster-containing enzyme